MLWLLILIGAVCFVLGICFAYAVHNAPLDPPWADLTPERTPPCGPSSPH